MTLFMPTIACHTLGCKVNQYDTQAMLELFLASGYTSVPFDSPADVYLINTCTVTGTGDKKSLQLARRIRRTYPESRLILCGCMAQQFSESLLDIGADLILGTQFRTEVVSLLDQAVRSGRPVCAVAPFPEKLPYEPLSVHAHDGHTRATLKIQEGCDNRCSYCIIPSVRGPVRSRPLEEIRSEALRLRDAGFSEMVLTGIHLSSYGRDFRRNGSSSTLLDAVGVLQDIPGIRRIRLGSLEPTIVTEAFASGLFSMDKVCPHFHLALQSGSDGVLRRMRRRYLTEGYLKAVGNLRAVYPRAALTTDVLVGFPGETEEEFQETCQFLRRVGFARIHVFPYSLRPGTAAAAMPGHLPRAVRESRARMLIGLGNEMTAEYLNSWTGNVTSLLAEEQINGCWEGYSPEYIRIRLSDGESVRSGNEIRVLLTEAQNGLMTALPCPSDPLPCVHRP